MKLGFPNETEQPIRRLIVPFLLVLGHNWDSDHDVIVVPAKIPSRYPHLLHNRMSSYVFPHGDQGRESVLRIPPKVRKARRYKQRPSRDKPVLDNWRCITIAKLHICLRPKLITTLQDYCKYQTNNIVQGSSVLLRTITI